MEILNIVDRTMHEARNTGAKAMNPQNAEIIDSSKTVAA